MLHAVTQRTDRVLGSWEAWSTWRARALSRLPTLNTKTSVSFDGAAAPEHVTYHICYCMSLGVRGALWNAAAKYAQHDREKWHHRDHVSIKDCLESRSATRPVKGHVAPVRTMVKLGSNLDVLFPVCLLKRLESKPLLSYSVISTTSCSFHKLHAAGRRR